MRQAPATDRLGTDRTVCVGSLELDCGEILPAVEQRVTIYGNAGADGSNVVLACHALTGSSRAVEWWPGIAGNNSLFDPDRWCVVGINVLGGCYGSTGPSNRSPFPPITVRDIVRAQRLALDQLGIARIACVIGGSLGGMQALQWAIDAPRRVGRALIVAAHDHYSAMGVALNAVQRDCLALDPVRGLRTARKLAMLTYKSEALLNSRHGRRPDRLDGSRFDVEGYLDFAADRFEHRMDAATYATLTGAMDSFDVRGAPAPSEGRPELIFVGIASDWLFRACDVESAARAFRGEGWDARCLQFESQHGHDAFLAEPDALRRLLEPYAGRS